MSMLR